MRVAILAIGRMRAGPEQSLYDTYVKRLPWPLTLKEIAEPKGAEDRVRREGELFLKALPPRARLVALDERGDALGSAEFAAKIGAWRDGGEAEIAFVIGGADGLAPEIRDRASLVLSLGAMTWPHLLARVMLAEQLYRAASILAGHPYHRA